MAREHLSFVVVGSVDHGKSTLIGRFLYDTGSLPASQLQALRRICRDAGEQVEFAFVLDHLQEERAGRITIDTAQRFFSSPSRDYTIIDAPGHREFLKNMVTGASQASAALLVLDAHEGIREQTRRHAFLVGLLGLRQLIVVLNKMDRVDFRRDVFDDMSRRTRDLLASVKLEQLAVIPAAALTGDNVAQRSARMGWYDGPTVVQALDLLSPDAPDKSLPLRLPVQDVYPIDSEPVGVGRVAAGGLRVGQEVEVCPAGRLARVAALRKFEGLIDSAGAGESIGFVLAPAGDLRRGQTICRPGELPAVSDSITANVFWLAESPLTLGESLTCRLATQEVPCRAEKIANRIDSGALQVLAADALELANTEVAEVTLAAGRPLQHDPFARIAEMGRLVLMRGRDVVAGGILP